MTRPIGRARRTVYLPANGATPNRDLGTWGRWRRLLAVGSNDLQARPGARGEQDVVGAKADVLAAPLGTHPDALLELVSCAQSGDGVDEVVIGMWASTRHADLAGVSAAGPPRGRRQAGRATIDTTSTAKTASLSTCLMKGVPPNAR
jgi:hypothetical protein